MNLLILDEPTNHLDLFSKDILLDALKKFTGTIIFVSHDRAFMEELSTKTLEVSSAKLYYGNYSYYLDRTSKENVNSKSVSKEANAALKNQSSEESAEQTNEQKRALEKQRQGAVRKLEKQEAEILKNLEELETSKKLLEAQLASPEVYSNGEKAKEVKEKLDECNENIELKNKEWETIAAKLEEKP